MGAPDFHLNVDSSIGPPINLLPIDGGQTVAALKDAIGADPTGVPVSLNELWFGLVPMDDDEKPFADYGVEDDDTVQVVARSGIVTYDMTLALAPPPFADQLAHLREDAVLSQTVAGVAAGSTYELGFYAQGSVTAAIQFLGAGDDPIGAPTTALASHISDDDLTAFTLQVTAPAGTLSAVISFTATSPALFLDVVTFNTI